ncbi:unnamed protein product [Heligmosomoides polygyrus]|uniref:RGS domain-containing protein n=2 Tax=Strongyloidea TaxID=27829 RepID=A0A183GVK0_HELPZ|nr:unnamed protein product [Heligmosomoides polygyrus]
MQKYLEKTGEIKFEKIFNQKLGFLLLKDFAENIAENACPQIKFYEAIKEYEKMETPEERLTKAREIYDHHIMVEMLAHAHNYSKDSLQHVQYHLLKGCVPPDLFQVRSKGTVMAPILGGMQKLHGKWESNHKPRAPTNLAPPFIAAAGVCGLTRLASVIGPAHKKDNVETTRNSVA